MKYFLDGQELTEDQAAWFEAEGKIQLSRGDVVNGMHFKLGPSRVWREQNNPREVFADFNQLNHETNTITGLTVLCDMPAHGEWVTVRDFDEVESGIPAQVIKVYDGLQYDGNGFVDVRLKEEHV